MSSDERSPDPVLPAIDDRLAVPETPYEIVEGRVVYVSPADPPHAMRQSKLAALLEAHTGLEYAVAADMLTRTSERDDVAPDVSVFPAAPDPVTGGRQLEHLAFEVVSTQTLRNAAYKADQLVGRGVRRVFAIDVEGGRALEWSRGSGKWEELHAAGEIEDLTLDVALPIKDLITTARSDDAVARALHLKGNPYFLEKLAEGRAEGKAEGRAEGKAEGRVEGKAEGRAEAKAESLMVVLATRGFVLDEGTRLRLLGERDTQRLDRWFSRALTCATVDELDAEP
jgi:Uma2 family endonuclease